MVTAVYSARFGVYISVAVGTVFCIKHCCTLITVILPLIILSPLDSWWLVVKRIYRIFEYSFAESYSEEYFTEQIFVRMTMCTCVKIFTWLWMLYSPNITAYASPWLQNAWTSCSSWTAEPTKSMTRQSFGLLKVVFVIQCTGCNRCTARHRGIVIELRIEISYWLLCLSYVKCREQYTDA